MQNSVQIETCWKLLTWYIATSLDQVGRSPCAWNSKPAPKWSHIAPKSCLATWKVGEQGIYTSYALLYLCWCCAVLCGHIVSCFQTVISLSLSFLISFYGHISGWQIKDDMRKPIYSALLRLLGDSDMAVQVSLCSKNVRKRWRYRS
jgi:hypothetical protein